MVDVIYGEISLAKVDIVNAISSARSCGRGKVVSSFLTDITSARKLRGGFKCANDIL